MMMIKTIMTTMTMTMTVIMITIIIIVILIGSIYRAHNKKYYST